MTKDQFVSQLERAAATLEPLPVSAAMARFLLEDLRGGDPAWWKETQKAWEKRTFTAWSEAWSLFLSCVHFEALSDAENVLVPFFPSCGGTDEADPSGALAKFLARAPGSFYDNLKTAQRRSYSALRAPLWVAPAALYFQLRDLPFYLVEVDAGAGLNLAADYVSPLRTFDSTLLSARIGLDAKPLLLEDIRDRRWLTAGVMPDHPAGIRDLDRAAEIVLSQKKNDANFIQLVESAPAGACGFVAQNVPADEDVGLLLLTMAATGRMADADYAAFSESVAGLMRSWGARALWVEVENVRGELYSTTYQLRAHRLLDGALKTCVMASLDLNARKVDYMKEAEAFLALGAPTKKKSKF